MNLNELHEEAEICETLRPVFGSLGTHHGNLSGRANLSADIRDSGKGAD